MSVGVADVVDVGVGVVVGVADVVDVIGVGIGFVVRVGGGVGNVNVRTAKTSWCWRYSCWS